MQRHIHLNFYYTCVQLDSQNYCDLYYCLLSALYVLSGSLSCNHWKKQVCADTFLWYIFYSPLHHSIFPVIGQQLWLYWLLLAGILSVFLLCGFPHWLSLYRSMLMWPLLSSLLLFLLLDSMKSPCLFDQS